MSMITWILAVAGIVLGLAIGWARGKQQLAGAVSRTDYDRLMQEKTALATRLETASAELDKAQRERTVYSERAITAEAENKALTQRLKEQQEQLRLEFNNTANKIFENFTQKFSTTSEKQIGDLIKPLRERLTDFQKKIEDSFGEQGKEQRSLKTEIEKIVLQADSLTKALRGDVKAQGNWGEVMLERILEESGLRRGEDYITQGEAMGLSGADGIRQMPDVIVQLPDAKHIIIDSKVSLSAYDRYCTEPNEIDLREFLKSVKAHVNGLSEKRYQHNDKLSTPDFVLLFMPIEGAYSLAIQQDRELHAYAWGRKIAIVCPSTLFVTLQTVASLWRIERQNKNAQDIAIQGGKLYDKFVGFVEDMQDIGTKMTGLHKSYDSAMNKLSEGRGNLVGSVEKLRQLGAKTSKNIPKELGGEEETEAPPLTIVG